MDKKIWYEVYKSDNDGSQTLRICETYDEAKKIKEELEGLSYNRLHIDKWANRDNPTRLAGLE